MQRGRADFRGAIPLDPATGATNPTKARRSFTEGDGELRQRWSGKGVYLNPRYGNVLARSTRHSPSPRALTWAFRLLGTVLTVKEDRK